MPDSNPKKEMRFSCFFFFLLGKWRMPDGAQSKPICRVPNQNSPREWGKMTQRKDAQAR